MNLHNPDLIAVWTEEGRDDAAATVETAPRGEALDIRVYANGKDLTRIALRWSSPLPRGARVLGDHWERGYGDLEWRGAVPERVLPWYAAVHDPHSGATYGVGVETGAAAIASWRIDPDGITLDLDVRCGGSGVRLGDRVLTAATVHYRPPFPDESPYQSVRGLCALLCPKPRLAGFPVYGGNDWYYAYGNNSDESIRRDSELIRSLSPNRDNAPFMVIDDGWYPTRGGGGTYTRGNEKFRDMPGLASAIRAMDVRPGIWMRPLLTGDEDAPTTWRMPENHPIYRLHKTGAFLDPSLPEVLERVRADVSRLHQWGYELIKHDFTTYDITGRWGFQMAEKMTPDGWSFADRSRTTAEIVRGLYQTIREAAGDTLLIGCNTIGHLGAGLFELQRTGDDTSGREWERTRKMGVNTLAFRMPQHDTFFAVDADCVGLTNAIPWELNRQWLDLLGRSGTPLFVSADPQAVGPEQRDRLREAFQHAAVPRAIAQPLDWLETTCPTHWRFGAGATRYDWLPREGALVPAA